MGAVNPVTPHSIVVYAVDLDTPDIGWDFRLNCGPFRNEPLLKFCILGEDDEVLPRLDPGVNRRDVREHVTDLPRLHERLDTLTVHFMRRKGLEGQVNSIVSPCSQGLNTPLRKVFQPGIV